MEPIRSTGETTETVVRAPDSPVRLRGAFVEAGVLYLYLTDRTDPEARKARFDLYTLADGTFLGSIPLPLGWAAIDGNDVFISGNEGVDRYTLAYEKGAGR